MPEANQQPDPNRRQTRSKNANAHPGRILIEASGVRRKPEDIKNEKIAKNERRKAREEKKSNQQAAVVDIANFENDMVMEDLEERAKFPRRRKLEATFSESPQSKISRGQPTTAPEAINRKTEATEPSRGKKRKGGTTKASSSEAIDQGEKTRKEKNAKAYQGNVAELIGFDTEPEIDESEAVQHGAKKRKTLAMPLRRTETYLQFNNMDITMQDIATPKPKNLKNNVNQEAQGEGRASQEDDESEDEDFETPKALRRNFVRSSSDDRDFMEKSDGDQEMADETESVDQNNESDASDSQNNESIYEKLKKEVNNPSRRLDFKKVDLTKAPSRKNVKKDKKAFRKEVEEKRALITMGEMNNKKIATGTVTAQVKETVSNATRSSGTTSSRGEIPKPAPFQDLKDTAVTRNNFQVATLEQKFRTSAIAGNGIDITVRSTSAGKESGVKFKPNSQAIKVENGPKSMPNSQVVTNVIEFSDSDEDNSVERTMIRHSPLKGIKRLSSKAIVKIEKSSSTPSSSESNEAKKKSRSKANILGDRDILSGWSKSIEPNFIYFYFYDLSPWPTTKDIEACAQTLWDWRFGDKHPLVFVESPQHVQLLNQKLCDVRTQAASTAIGNLEIEFRLAAADNSFDLSNFQQADIVEGRQTYAQDLLDDKKFIFGKLVFSDQDGSLVRKSQPYQNKLLLRTFSASFKHIKDVKRSSDAPLPSSGHPKTLLAIATAAVERALTLTVDGDYDFVTNRLIPKPDPSHPSRKLTMIMLAFSEATWESRVQFYLEKGIAKLKDKDWKNIMNAAAEYSNAIKLDDPSAAARKPKLAATEEEAELEWDSESESEPDLETH